MKAIINGKRYDTEKAREVADSCNGYGCDDYDYLQETIYLTKSGRWFLVGEGGANTGYAQQSGNSRCGGKKLVPLLAVDAKLWLEEHNKVEAVEEHFGSSVTDA